MGRIRFVRKLNVLLKWSLFLAGPHIQAIQISCQLCSNVDIKYSWAHQILQRAHKNFKWPIKIWKLSCIRMGSGPLAHFKGPSLFWARINPATYILKRKRNATVFNPLFLPHGSHESNFLNYILCFCALSNDLP